MIKLVTFLLILTSSFCYSQDTSYVYYYGTNKIKLIQVLYEENYRLDYYLDTNGLLLSSTEFLDNKKHGIQKHYYKSQIIKGLYTYKNGEKNGIQINYYESSMIKDITVHQNNLFNGPVQYYSEYGLMIATGYYKNDLQIGEWVTYDNDGKIKFIRMFDENGNLIEKRKTR